MGYIRARLASFSLSLPLMAIVGLSVGCGDNTPANTATGGSGGSSTGGVGGGTGGGTGGIGGGLGGVGGATGGVGGVGGATGGVGGGTGGVGGVGGATGGVGGATGGVGGGTGGVGGKGGGTGGGGGKGGVGGGTGGIGGTVGTGGVGGGTGGIGGGTGGATGGIGGGTGGTTACYTTAFTAPAAGAVLTVADDSDHTCANGIQYTVTISSGAPNGTDVTLYDGTSLLQTVKVNGGAASFAVQLATSSTAQQLSIQYPTTAACNVTENVTVSCPNSPPTCTISAPVISATHPDLNGVPTPQGDRSSSGGSPYQATFVVSTSAEDGQAVTLAVDNTLAPGTPVDGTPSATVSGGSASFGLTLVPDGTYEVIATCVNKNGIAGTSTKSSFTVDTTPPVLAVNSPTAGQFVVGGTINACAQTTSSDAASLAGSLGSARNNLCVTLGSSATPSCVAIAAVNTSTCVSLACPGAAPFSLTFTLNDAAGNPTTQTVSGVTCASSLPAVQIVAPASDAPTFTDSSKHILAANAPVGIRDEDGSTPGAQADVVACTDTSGTATLFVGHKGDSSLAQLGSAILTTAAAAGDNCPSGSAFVAHFPGVTLPESTENANGTLAAATELQVSITSATNSADTGTSLPDDVWVDSVAPSLVFASPAGLCGSFTQSATPITEDVSYTADDKLVVADVTNNGVTTTYDTPAYVGGVATFGSVVFAEGQNALVATESDPAGNATVLPACVVTVGTAPVVTFTMPTPAALLCPNGATATGCIDDVDPGTPGWQGALTVHVTASGANVVGSVITFTDGATTFGTATTDASGNATLTPVTVAEGTQTILATTDNVPGAGVGSGTVTVTVDTTAPNAPTNLTALVLDRRKTSMQLTWTAPSDIGGGNVAGYQIRYAKVPITTVNFNDNTVTTVVTYSGTPASHGQLDGITVSPLYVENGYYFAVEATDVAGNVSPMLASPPSGACTCATQCCAAHFNVTTLVSGSTSNEALGFSVSAEGDVNGDGLSDVLAGTSLAGRAYLFFGASSFAAEVPGVTFSGAAATFGLAVGQIGDVDNDGLPDIAIADSANRMVYIYKGRTTWPATLTDTQANYVISGIDASYAGSFLGSSISRLGDFTGDGIADFALGARGFNGNIGRVVIIPGKASGFATVTLPDAANSIVINGDPALGSGNFGYRVLGLGHFYSTTTGTTLVASAPGRSSAAPSAVYAFHGQTGTAGVISIGSADAVFNAPTTAMHIGEILSNLGPALGAALPGVGLGNPVDNTTGPGANGTGYLFFSPQGTAPFANSDIVALPSTTQAGGLIIGGGLSGGGAPVSLIGDSATDVVFGPKAGASFAIFDGSLLTSKPSPVTASTSAEVLVPMPGNTGEGEGSIITDINGDGHGDFCIGTGVGAAPGSVVVYW
jgi:hypothetical protein